MKKIKKKYINKMIIFPTALIIIIGMIGIKYYSSLSYSEQVIEELNDNTNFPYKFTVDLDKFDLNEEEWVSEKKFNYTFFTNKKEEGVLMFCGYPDLKDSDKLTYYRFDKNYSVFGIHNNDSVTFADTRLKSFGYKQIDTGEYEKGRVTILVGSERIEKKGEIIDVVKGFSISIYNSDWFFKGNYK